MDEEIDAKTTDMPVYRYTCIEISLQRTPETPSRTIKGFYNLHINVEYLETLSLEGWTLSLSPCYILCDGRPILELCQYPTTNSKINK